MTALDDWIADLRAGKYSDAPQTMIADIDNAVAALLLIQAGLPTGLEIANTVLAGPASGIPANPTYRALVGADLPNPQAAVLGGVQSKAVVANTFLTGISTAGVVTAAQPAILGASDYQNGSWTPVDTSGAGLTFTQVTGNYTKLGNMVFAYCSATYPSTVNGSNAQIGGLPFSTPNPLYGRQSFTADTTSATVVFFQPPINGTTVSPKLLGGATATNAQMSLVGLYFTACYSIT